jgi:hypothetical protein
VRERHSLAGKIGLLVCVTRVFQARVLREYDCQRQSRLLPGPCGPRSLSEHSPGVSGCGSDRCPANLVHLGTVPVAPEDLHLLLASFGRRRSTPMRKRPHIFTLLVKYLFADTVATLCTWFHFRYQLLHSAEKLQQKWISIVAFVSCRFCCAVVLPPTLGGSMSKSGARAASISVGHLFQVACIHGVYRLVIFFS